MSHYIRLLFSLQYLKPKKHLTTCMKKILITLSALAMTGLASHAATITIDPAYDFDVATDFTSNFTNNTGATYAWNATAGIGGTGGVVPTVGDGTFTAQTNASAAFGTDSQTISMFFLFDSNGQSNAASNQRIGIGTVNSGGNSGEFRGVNFQLLGGALTDQWTPRLRVRANTVSTGLSSFSLTDDTWYRMDASFQITNTVDGSFDYDFSLYNYGTAGTSLVSTVFSHSSSVAAAALDSTNARHLAFIATQDANGYGAQAIDNFGTVAVPEPATYALITGFLAIGVILVRRRRQF